MKEGARGGRQEVGLFLMVEKLFLWFFANLRTQKHRIKAEKYKSGCSFDSRGRCSETGIMFGTGSRSLVRNIRNGASAVSLRLWPSWGHMITLIRHYFCFSAWWMKVSLFPPHPQLRVAEDKVYFLF